jgi:hypothetical protein
MSEEIQDIRLYHKRKKREGRVNWLYLFCSGDCQLKCSTIQNNEDLTFRKGEIRLKCRLFMLVSGEKPSRI